LVELAGAVGHGPEHVRGKVVIFYGTKAQIEIFEKELLHVIPKAAEESGPSGAMTWLKHRQLLQRSHIIWLQ
jgi:hypothetical protein